MENSKSRAVFYVAIAVTVVAVLLSIYQAIPNIYHFPVPAYAEPMKVHEKYAELFGGIAALGMVVALLAWPKTRGK